MVNLTVLSHNKVTIIFEVTYTTQRNETVLLCGCLTNVIQIGGQWSRGWEFYEMKYYSWVMNGPHARGKTHHHLGALTQFFQQTARHSSSITGKASFCWNEIKWSVISEIWEFQATFQPSHINNVKYVMIMSICRQITWLFSSFDPHQ